MIARLSPFFKKTGNEIPSVIGLTKEQILRWWDYWLLWRMTGKRVEAFALVVDWKGPMSKSMLETFFELDNFMAKMEAQRLEKELKK